MPSAMSHRAPIVFACFEGHEEVAKQFRKPRRHGIGIIRGQSSLKTHSEARIAGT